MTAEKDKAVSLDVATAMFDSYKAATSSDGPLYDEASGRYVNKSIELWLDSYADGLVYGVQVPKFESSTGATATKTDANAGLVLEASTNETAGQNDYTGKKLFMCPRVNGGVDADGMPYVTAIEGMDNRFSASGANTWALTPVYYVKYTEADTYVWQQYSDTPLEGFEACPGAYTHEREPRPYILRACYMDSDGTGTSKSGTVPASYTAPGIEGNFAHCLATDAAAVLEREDGIGFLSYADVTYHIEFMQLMLGVKAPKSVARGFCLNTGFASIQPGDADHTIRAYNANPFTAGLYINVCTAFNGWHNAAAYGRLRAARITAREPHPQYSGWTILTLDQDTSQVTSSDMIYNCFPRNGSCDAVLGTFGAISSSALTDGYHPFRFQNIELGLGLFEVCADMIFNNTSEATVAYIAPDAGTITLPLDTSASCWTALPNAPVSNGDGRYIKDYTTDNGAKIPASIGCTSSQGYRAALISGTGVMQCLVYGGSNDEPRTGIGCIDASTAINATEHYYGTRISSVSRSSIPTQGGSDA